MYEIRKEASVRVERTEEEVVGRYCPGTEEVVGVYIHGHPEKKAVPAAKPARNRHGFWIFLVCAAVLLAAFAVALLLTGGEDPQQILPPDRWDDLPYPEYTGVHLPRYPLDGTRVELTSSGGSVLTPQEVYARAHPAVVTVMVGTVDGRVGAGTGVIVSADGYLLTNYHVIEGGYECEVALWDNSTRRAWYVGGNAFYDVAVLKIDSETPLPFLEIGDSKELSVGDTVYAIGSPLSIELQGTFTNGIVSAVDRVVELDDRSLILLQTNAALNQGNSGGPLINCAGQVVGITTIKMMSDYSTVEGLGFAIPSDIVVRIVNQLLESGQVSPQPLMGITVEYLGVLLPDGTIGALITEVRPGAASEKAGILPYDIIVEMDGDPVHGSADVLRVRERFTVGDEMPLRIFRDGTYLDVVLSLRQAAE